MAVLFSPSVSSVFVLGRTSICEIGGEQREEVAGGTKRVWE